MAGTSRLRAATGSRRAGSRAVLFWGVAAIAGLGAALMSARYLDRKTVTVGAPIEKIVVAAIDLPMATRLTQEHLKMVEWPVSALPPGAVRDTKEIIDRVLISHVISGEPIRAAQLAPKDAGNGLAALIPMHMRAMAVRVDDVVGVAGFIHPDDRVDVIVTLRPAKPVDAESTSKVILQNVKVLAVGKEIEVADQARRQASPATVATLLVSPDQAEKLALAANEGRLVLTLRSWTDSTAVDTSGMNPSALMAETGAAALAPIPVVGGAPKEAAPEVAPPLRGKKRHKKGRVEPIAATQAPPKKETVEILRGDRFEERKFDRKGAR
ncbi:MAG TPA: Flp pilus assembly protein CpaB [Polyangia bacterium]|jgi:pilus assembly protein CpaB